MSAQQFNANRPPDRHFAPIGLPKNNNRVEAQAAMIAMLMLFSLFSVSYIHNRHFKHSLCSRTGNPKVRHHQRKQLL